MRFWLKTLRLLAVYAGLALGLSAVIYVVLQRVFDLGFVSSALLACIGSVVGLFSLFYVIVYKKKYYTIANKYIESIDLLQNCLFFVFFPYLGIVLAQVDVAPLLTEIRQIVGATLLTLKITMLLIKYTLKQAPLATLDD